MGEDFKLADPPCFNLLLLAYSITEALLGQCFLHEANLI